jgi:hypothetical protein
MFEPERIGSDLNEAYAADPCQVTPKSALTGTPVPVMLSP